MAQGELGFSRGLGAVFSATRRLIATPRLWPYALVPMLVATLLAALGTYAAFTWLGAWVRSLLPASESWFAQYGARALALVTELLGAAATWFAALAVAPTLSAPALERMVGIVEAELGAPPRAPLSWLGEMWCGLRTLLASLAILTPLALVLWLLDVIAPPLSVITVPLRAILAALALAWNLLDYPLTLRGIGISARLRSLREHWSAVLGFGAGFSLLFWFPCCAVALLPIGVIAAAELSTSMLSPRLGAAN